MTPRVGLIARADSGGLGTITQEFYRHLHPDKTLIVDLGAGGRGPNVLAGRYGLEAAVCAHPIPDDAWTWLLAGTDVLYTAEYGYRPGWAKQARDRGARTVMHVMPELDPHDDVDQVLVPTTWEATRSGLGQPARYPRGPVRIMGIPIAADRLPYRRRMGCETLLFVDAPAMLDRCGRLLVKAALPQVTNPCRVLVRGGNPNEWSVYADDELPSHVQLEWLRPTVNYWEYPEFDVLLAPRRYGGLSLPLQEAAALGAPAITLSTEVPRPFLHELLQVGVARSDVVDMKGGPFSVYDANPHELALAIDYAIGHPGLIEAASSECGRWAAENGWSLRAGDWTAMLEEVAGR